MSNTSNEPDQIGQMEDSLTPATPTDALLPNKGEPEKNPATLKTSLSSRADTMNKVLMKASSLTRRKNSLNDPMNRTQESHRDIIANDFIYNQRSNYANNHIKTSKYTALTFIPLNLFEQFQRLANFYFLCLLILQLIPVISSLTPITTLLPLVGVLTITGLKDAYDDLQRHRTDRQVNNRESQVLRKGHLVEEKWHRVQVGDVIRITNDQFIAADILLLSSSQPNGLCFIETAELDGETNLKTRQCDEATNSMGDNAKELSEFKGHIKCEPPNNNLSRFEGTLVMNEGTANEKIVPLENDNILLRGTILRNTDWCYGVVIFAGKDTKLIQNSGKAKFKRTSIDRLLNFVILGIVFFLLCMCLFCTVACGVWESLTGYYFQKYLEWEIEIPKDKLGGATVISLLVFFSYAIVLNTVVPISLYVSVECIRFVQSLMINWDIEMYDEKSDTPAQAKTTTLNEELGQIQYVFSDKTGTLTQNIMTFNKCSIDGKAYGDMTVENQPKVDFSRNPYYTKDFEFYDQSLLDNVQKGDPSSQEFFRLLALCHTVMPQVKNGELVYQAQSPDEDALVSAARNFGFVFKERTPRSITISFNGQEEVYELLCILDFNNVRKRMSVILRRDGKIRLYCKGADTVILARLAPGNDHVKAETQEHLDKFASDGLRTLLCGIKDLTEDEFQTWKAAHHEAAVALTDREEKLDFVYNEIEKNLQLAGATAIEDKLQDGVPQTIQNILTAGIKLWVLTGDKQETAINIGYSSNLLTDELYNDEPFIVDGDSHQDVQQQLSEIKKVMERVLDSKDMAKKNRRSHTQEDLSMSTFSDESSVNDNDIPYGHQNGSFKPEKDHHSTSKEALARGQGTFASKNDIHSSPVSSPVSLGGDEFALVVNGHSLVYALGPEIELLFLAVAEKCSSVICCRVTPLQKAMVVELVKKYKKAVTLSIGDGANDVSMIKTAHIGIGISGQEGMQAVLASDYSISQFRFLERLLLVHGRWSYYRMCKFLRYFFYKNFAFTLCHLWYAFFCGFSATTLFEDRFIAVYNLFYTSQPVLALGIFDQDVDDKLSIKFPKLYTPGLTSSFFNKQEFFRSALQGFVTSCVLFFMNYGAFFDKANSMGYSLSDYMSFGSVTATCLVIIVNAQIALDTTYWTIFNHILIWGSILIYFLLQFVSNFLLGGKYIGSLYMVLSDYTFWFTCALTTVVLLVPVAALRFYRSDAHPTLTDKARMFQRHTKREDRKKPDRGKAFSARRSRRSVRSGYAFAHQEGFGRLITSGRIMKQGQQGNPSLPSFHTSMIQAMPRIRATSQSKQRPVTTPVHEENIVQAQSNQTDGRDNVRTVQLSINGQSREVPLPNQVSN